MDHIYDRNHESQNANANSSITSTSTVESDQTVSFIPPPLQLMAQYSEKEETELATSEKSIQFQIDSGAGDENPSDDGTKPNNTGLPDPLKNGIENLSGFSLDDIKVHRNSNKPSQLNAHAYAQGSEIHLGPGQEKHLPHEAWHVVQQKQGRVKPTMQLKAFNINDDAGLEKEADVMGNKAMNAGSEYLESQRFQMKSTNKKVYQRVQIPAVNIPGMAGDMDTSDYYGSISLINQLFDRGNHKVIRDLYFEIVKGKQHEENSNNQYILDFIDNLLSKFPTEDPESAKSGILDTLAIKWSQTAPANPDEQVRAGLRLWIAGDPSIPGLGWKTIGLYLQGRLSDEEIIELGDTYYAFFPIVNMDDEVVLDDTMKKAKGEGLIANAIGEIQGALDALPAFDGKSYRQSGVLDGTVFGQKITINDYIKDKGFWSTAALKVDGSAGTWGEDGTKEKPKVYYIINGSTGKYINKYAALEEGQHEVLFKNGTIFQVNKIANYRKETFFVHLTEVDPSDLDDGVVLKDPYTGDPQT